MSLPKISVVTISFNQHQFLQAAIESVLAQNYPNLEYIVVDPGSTDGSREMIERYRDRIAHVVFERDKGAADGLNRGFALATGDIYCYLNSDDEFEPGAFHAIATCFAEHPNADVICGHGLVIGERGEHIRRVWSDPVNLISVAYGASISIQPSTFIKREAFLRVGGFNPENKIAWDGELVIALAKSGAQFQIVDKFLSKYRIHQTSITGSGSQGEKVREWHKRRFQMIMGRSWTSYDAILRLFWLAVRQIRNPKAFWERLIRGRVYGRAAS